MFRGTAHGKAFEYACLASLKEFIDQHPESELSGNIELSSAVEKAKRDFGSLNEEHGNLVMAAGTALAEVLIKTEPRLIYRTKGLHDKVDLSLQPDSAGRSGDVRDILAVRIASRFGQDWVIGVSCKHNHDAVKHPRVSPTINIGQQWLGYSCDYQYWNDIRPVFEEIQPYVHEGRLWCDLDLKEERVYVPLLKAVRDQIKRIWNSYGDAPVANLLHYLIGKNDFYKAIVSTRNRTLEVQGFNINGTLGLPSLKNSPVIRVSQLALPSRLYEIHFVEGSTNTIRLVMDQGWQISMRIHSASKAVENSLKMDIRLEGIPTHIFTQTEGF